MPSPGGIFLPHFMENGWDGNITQAIFAPLVGLDKEGKPIPILAKKLGYFGGSAYIHVLFERWFKV
ncbi:hypothetical protein ACT7C5_23820 [Bacillus pacificus]